MNKILFFAISLFLITQATSNAAVYKGQKTYVKECRQCHGGGQAVAASKKIKDWKRLFKNKGAELADIHLSSEKAKDSWEYFQSDKYKRYAKHLKDFLSEYAKDSGKVPACN